MAKQLSQNGTFEIPSLKKNIVSFENQIQDLGHTEHQLKNSITTNEKDYQTYCQKFGIAGENIHVEVPGLIGNLPALFDSFINKI
mmetsp:Transcript_1748/g.1620  ORF Transcript_1748/g.1620 Transcript_1748/m.1620 type:complete len:85 (+) Transcript_1748:408-662(+)